MDENVKYLSVIPNAGEQLSVTFMGNVNHRNLNGLGLQQELPGIYGHLNSITTNLELVIGIRVSVRNGCSRRYD